MFFGGGGGKGKKGGILLRKGRSSQSKSLRLSIALSDTRVCSLEPKSRTEDHRGGSFVDDVLRNGDGNNVYQEREK